MATLSLNSVTKLPSIEWDTAPAMKELTRLRHLTDDNQKGIVVSGEDIREYISPLIHDLRKFNAIIIPDYQELLIQLQKIGIRADDSYKIGKIIPQRHVSSVFQVLSSINTSDMVETFASLYKIDKNFDPRLLVAIYERMRDNWSNRIVVYGASLTENGLTYFDAITPTLSQALTTTVWVLLGDTRINRLSKLPTFERDYARWGQLIGLVSEAKSLDEAQLRFLLETNVPPPPRYSRLSADRLTGSMVGSFYRYYDYTLVDDINVIAERFPRPLSAPFEFTIRDNKLHSNRRVVGDLIKNDPTQTVVLELIEQINDVTSTYSLSNSAPIMSQKLNRLKETLKALREDPTESTIIRAGILVGSIKSHLPFEVENIDDAAQGGVRASVQQIELFLNRLRAWRDYLWEIDRPEGDVGEAATNAAAELLDSIASSGARIIDRQTAIEVDSYLKGVTQESTSSSEREGLVRSAQNVLAVIANYINDQVKSGIRDSPKGLIGDAVKLGAVGGLATLVMTLETIVMNLAHAHPVLFGWTVEFLTWLRTLSS